MQGKEQKQQVIEKMNESYNSLIKKNSDWVEKKLESDPKYFTRLEDGQQPEFFMIGSSDSRVPLETIVDADPGEIFVHRNVANLVVNTDTNLMSALQYAVEVLNVKHIIVCGHYNCGAIKASMKDKDMGVLNKWLNNIKDIYRMYKHELEAIEDENQRTNRLIELNAEEQALNLLKIGFIQKNRALYGYPQVHAWVYELKTGKIKDLQSDIEEKFKEFDSIYKVY